MTDDGSLFSANLLHEAARIILTAAKFCYHLARFEALMNPRLQPRLV